MSRTQQIFKIYLFTLLIGTVLSLLTLGVNDMFIPAFSGGISLSFMGSLPGLLFTLAVNYFYDTASLDDFKYFRLMLRVLAGILTLTFLVLFLGYNLEADLIRCYFVYSLVAISLTFYFLKPKKV